uniref:Uncharacterized protein n=1 Tax=viral metagenome TaxID=1070528 RepID=A0A6C0JRE4_9ZZZZ
MTVYIASMNLRGKWAERPDNALLLNVTSAQGKTNKNRLAFSPMTETGYRGYYNFEAFWQSGKVYKDIPEEKTKQFWKAVKQPKRRYPGSKGKTVLYSKWEHTDKLDYVSSRKKVYVPLYYDMVKDEKQISFWKEQLSNGNDIVIYDFDGPRLDDGSVTCLKVTRKLLQEKINDTRFPFGHGYVVAMLLKDISLQKIVG